MLRGGDPGQLLLWVEDQRSYKPTNSGKRSGCPPSVVSDSMLMIQHADNLNCSINYDKEKSKEAEENATQKKGEECQGVLSIPK